MGFLSGAKRFFTLPKSRNSITDVAGNSIIVRTAETMIKAKIQTELPSILKSAIGGRITDPALTDIIVKDVMEYVNKLIGA
jgi:hypothetical protein